MRSAVAASLVLLTACAWSDDTSSAAVPTYEPRGDGGDAALLDGTLVLAGGCFYVMPADGKRVLAVFPVDEVETDGNTLTYSDVEYVDGDPISVGGGALSGGSEVRAEAVMPESCDSDGSLWLVAQSG